MKTIKFLVVLLVALVALLVPSMALAKGNGGDKPPKPEPTKVVVCHKTASPTNPYTSNLVSVHSVDDANGLNGHGGHGGDIWAPFVFDGVTYPGQGDMSILENGCKVPPPANTLSVSGNATCSGWSVTATVNQGSPLIVYLPGQSGDWSGNDEVTVHVTAFWLNGKPKVIHEKVTLSKPDDCDPPEDVCPATPGYQSDPSECDACLENPQSCATEEPTEEPTEVVTEEPTEEPTEVVTEEPTEEPTPKPTKTPPDRRIMYCTDSYENGKGRVVLPMDPGSLPESDRADWDGQDWVCVVPRCVDGELEFVDVRVSDNYPQATKDEAGNIVCQPVYTPTPVAPPAEPPATGEGLSPTVWDLLAELWTSIVSWLKA